MARRTGLRAGGMMHMEYTPQVSLIVVAYNAAAYLGALLADIRAQTYAGKDLEIVLIDSASTDSTRGLMEAFAAEAASYAVRVLDNPGRILACGCNVALDACRGRYLVRIDAHASIPPDFLQNNVRAMEGGRDIVGGRVAALPPRNGREVPLVMLDSSRFAGGAAPFRNAGTSREVDALAYALVRREVYDRVGRFDERLIRTEDNDMAYRMRQAGYRFFYSPDILSYHCARPSLRGQLRQKWQNGRWIGLSMGVQPRMFAPRHFVPLAFVLALALTAALALAGQAVPLVVLLSMYALCNAGFCVHDAWKAPKGRLRCVLQLPWMFLLVHLCYGAGTFCGLFGARGVARQPKKREGAST